MKTIYVNNFRPTYPDGNYRYLDPEKPESRAILASAERLCALRDAPLIEWARSFNERLKLND